MSKDENSRRVNTGVAETPSEVVIGPVWPLSQWADRRISYGRPLVVLSALILPFTVTRWLMAGMPTMGIEMGALFIGVLVAVGSAAAIFAFDGMTITGNREQIVIKQWLQRTTVIPVADLAVLQMSTMRQHDSARDRTIDEQIVRFIAKDEHCVYALNWEQFTDQDLDQLSQATGVRQDGSWSNIWAA